MEKRYQITSWCHRFIRDQVQLGDVCIDATVGRGNDTQLLCELVGDSGKVYGFDIQEEALSYTENRLEAMNCELNLILDGHENMKQYVKEKGVVSCIVFNFGYLPAGDHNVSTVGETSIQAMEDGLQMLKKEGIMSLCIYSGGDSGFEERDAVLQYLKNLDSKKYLVIVSQYYNRPNNPPIPAVIIKL